MQTLTNRLFDQLSDVTTLECRGAKRSHEPQSDEEKKANQSLEKEVVAEVRKLTK